MTHPPLYGVVADPQVPVRKLEHIQLALPVPGKYGRKRSEPPETVISDSIDFFYKSHSHQNKKSPYSSDLTIVCVCVFTSECLCTSLLLCAGDGDVLLVVEVERPITDPFSTGSSVVGLGPDQPELQSTHKHTHLHRHAVQRKHIGPPD